MSGSLPTRMILWIFCCCHVFIQSTKTSVCVNFQELWGTTLWDHPRVIRKAGVTEIDVPQQTILLKMKNTEIVMIALEVFKNLKFSRHSYQVDLQSMMMTRDKELHKLIWIKKQRWKKIVSLSRSYKINFKKVSYKYVWKAKNKGEHRSSKIQYYLQIV